MTRVEDAVLPGEQLRADHSRAGPLTWSVGTRMGMPIRIAAGTNSQISLSHLQIAITPGPVTDRSSGQSEHTKVRPFCNNERMFANTRLLSRRAVLQHSASGFGFLGLQGLLAGQAENPLKAKSSPLYSAG